MSRTPPPTPPTWQTQALDKSWLSPSPPPAHQVSSPLRPGPGQRALPIPPFALQDQPQRPPALPHEWLPSILVAMETFLTRVLELQLRPTWPLVTMGLLGSDFRGFLSFKYPILLPYQLWVWEIWSASAGNCTGRKVRRRRAGPGPAWLSCGAQLWLVSTSCVQLLSTQLSTRPPERQRPTDLFTGWGRGDVPNDTGSPELGLTSAQLMPCGQATLPARLSLPGREGEAVPATPGPRSGGDRPQHR